MPYQRLAREVLEQWRELERRLAQVGEGSVAGQLLTAQADVLRREYQHLVDEAIAHHRPEPPPFPNDEGFGGDDRSA